MMTTLYGCAVFLSAFLLFQIQLILAKVILPWFGGSPGVWTTCMLFFETALLAGYAYAHGLIRLLSARRQVLLHVLLLGAVVLFLPPAPEAGWQPQGDENPVWRILAMLGVTIGLPFVVLSATAPLLQVWYGRSGGRSPYKLYALSNAGSLIGPLSYPLWIERNLTLHGQLVAWSLLLLLFVAVVVPCAVRVWRSAPGGVGEVAGAGEPDRVLVVTPQVRFLWLAYPFCSTLLFLGVTNQLCQEVAVVPFLWVVPLGVYLLSYILCFASDRWYRRRLFLFALALGIVGLLLAAGQGNALSMTYSIPIYGGGLFIACMCCHGELVLLRPPLRQLTSFYLLISVGGALAGVAAGILAPGLFSTFAELPAAIFLCVILVWAGMSREILARIEVAEARALVQRFVHGVTWLLAGLWLAGVAALALVPVEDHYRNFYGVLRISEIVKVGGGTRFLYHGATRHGQQNLDSVRALEPTAYYGTNSGVGLAFRVLPPGEPWRVGVVGLGVGTVMSYGRTGDVFRFYEINPLVTRLARDKFTFLSQGKARSEVLQGDARLTLQREEPQRYDLLMVDAFSSDSIPVHLLTREAFDVYLRHLKPDGLLVLHMSNKHLDLSPVFADQLAAFDLHGTGVRDATEGDGLLESVYVVASRDPARIAAIQALHPDNALEGVHPVPRPWTDDYSNPLSLLKF